MERLHIVITGQVQGVGFRPHVYRIAHKFALTGWVQNNSSGVVMEIQGAGTLSFLSQLTTTLPPLARIDNIQHNSIALIDDETTFHIIPSQAGTARTMISPDIGICTQCLQELFEPSSRYYHYPFLNCTHCGPRFSITRNLPYDRAQTAMDAFPLCDPCQKDYLDPTNRRYHAQPTACGQCGPKLSFPISAIAQALRDGQIIAIKGLGGYQLVCDAQNNTAIERLRLRKNRSAKPFALMTINSRSARAFVVMDDKAQTVLESPARPILILPKHGNTLPATIAPDLSHLGVMLPSTPLHYLLFNALAGYPEGHHWLDAISTLVLIVTSANINGEPLVIEDESAHRALAGIADIIVSYNRLIVTRMDDSVMRIINHAPVFIRRARGFVPERIKLPYPIPPTLALGGQLKNTFCITRGDEAFVSQHIGDLNNRASIDFFHESLTHWIHCLDVTIERVACDLHPDFYTSHWAHEHHVACIPIQHHHAHLAAVAAEHHLLTPTLGLALDGYGYGADGQAWGGELCLFDTMGFVRLGSLLPIPQPGGDVATREPWRMGASMLHVLGMNQNIPERFADKPQAATLAELLKSAKHLPLTSSCGRLFDAASALLGVNLLSQYEGHAAMALESLVTTLDVLANGWHVENNQLNFRSLFMQLLNTDPVSGANLFHGTLIAGLVEWIVMAARQVSIPIIVLSGGCFLNKVLSEGLITQLAQNGITAHLPRHLPPNDGGLSLGQAWIAGHAHV